MASKKSRPYEVDGSNYVFGFGDDGKLVSIKKADDGGNYKSLNPSSSEFNNLEFSVDGLNAYNVNKHKGNTDLYEDSIESSSDDVKNLQFEVDEKKSNNESFISNDTDKPPSISNSPSYATPYEGGSKYKRKNTTGKPLYAYPFDIDPNQDHLKIQQWDYIRPSINASGAARRADQETNIAGESVKDSELIGSVLLPMPKVVDVNGADWGENKLTSFGLGALGATSGLGRLIGLTPGENLNDKEKRNLFREELKASGALPESEEQFQNLYTSFLQSSQTALTTGVTGLAGSALGVNISPDTILARTSGVVLNPNAEMLFQGPVIRDFNFSFNMIARSKREGEEIRKIIKFLKVGMAPQYSNNVFLKTPNIFTLEYRNAGGVLKTVNKFNPGGLALTTINIDYAPSGYWSAYRDSQPVALKMDLNFSELRPIYQGDQEKDEVFSGFDSVGY